MANITKTSWPEGWNPSADKINGSPNSLLRMDNLRSDETGALTLVKGGQKLNNTGFSDYIYKIYSEKIGTTEAIWVALNKTGRQVLRTKDNFSSTTTVLDGGGGRPCFVSFLDEVLICSGSKRVKDNGSRVFNLGIETPTVAPKITAINQDSIDMSNGTYSMLEGHDPQFLEPSYLVFVDSTTLRGVIQMDYGSRDSLNIAGDPNPSGAADLFTILFQPHDTNSFTKFRVEFYVSDDNLNYYWFEWPVATSNFQLGINQQTIASCMRSDFNREGSDASSDWTTVKKLRITGIGIADTWFLAGEMKFTGGSQGSLNNAYELMVVNVSQNSNYQGRSGISPISDAVNVFHGRVEVQLPSVSDTQVTEQWLFARGVAANFAGFTINLDKFYRVAVAPPGTSVTFNQTDDDTLRDGITANEFLLSVGDVPDFIVGMESYKGRLLYITDRYILLSDPLNMDAIDQRFTIKAFGGTIERNLWIKRITNDLILLATTSDLYEITGTLEELPDGTLDINVRPLGEKYPPLSDNFAFSDGNILYVSSVGVRITGGSNSTNLSDPLNLIFNGEDRYGIPGFYADLDGDYPITIGKNKIYVGLEHTDGTRRLFVFDTNVKQWRLEAVEPVALHTTPTEKVLVGFGGGEGNFIRQWEQGVDYDGTVPIKINFLTVFDANGQPRNRKDTFTLKLVLDTGGDPIDIALGKDGTDPTFIKTISSNGNSTQYIDLHNYSLGFRYALQITSNGLRKFKLQEVTIEYDARPEQQIYLRIPTTNLGTQARKRFIAFPFVIDTLGQDVTFTPIVDGVTKTPSIVNKNGKFTHIHFFTEDTTGIDIGGILSDNIFEFYDINLSEAISEKIPAATKFLLIPSNNYGNPNRKRHTSYKFQINTLGHNIVFTPRLDGVNYAPHTFNTTEKKTVEYFFDTSIDVIGIDIGGMLSGEHEFEFYGDITPQQLEILPPRLSSLYIPPNNYGTPNRKRHTSYKFEINTFGDDCTFTPIIDGNEYLPLTFNTPSKGLVEYFFTDFDIKGKEIGGTLISEGQFEFYGTVIPQTVEQLPDRLKTLYTPGTNYGVPARKRIRTIPIIIDTNGGNVSFEPLLDTVGDIVPTFALPQQFNTGSRKQTVLYYFNEDVFPIDISGVLTSLSGIPFEFYSYGQPEIVETLPVGKLFDQIGPLLYDKIAKLFELRIRLIATVTEVLSIVIYGDNSNTIHTNSAPVLYSGQINTVAFTDQVYTIDFPKSINSTTLRIVIGPASGPFHRYDAKLKLQLSGMESSNKWITIR